MATSSSAAAAKIALVEISVAAAVIPAAWPVAQIVYFNQCDPEARIATGLKWLEIYDTLGTAKGDLEAAVSELSPLQWTGDDRQAFGKHIVAYDVQLLGTQILAITVGLTLVYVGSVLLILVITYTIISTILAAFAVFIAAAGATVVGAPAAASAMATANTIAATSATVLRAVEKAAELAGVAGATAIGGAMAFDVGMQLGTGNTDVLGSLVKAAVDGYDNVLAGFLSKAERDFVGHGIYSSGRHAANPNGPGYLMYGLLTQVAPAGKDDDGNNTYGPSGVVDNLWNSFADGDAWNG
ncbi:MAG TPA: hypothetical protein VFX60_15935 [Micromonospora sp.]|nr:hypothetical protein [Micromonospora sp.]